MWRESMGRREKDAERLLRELIAKVKGETYISSPGITNTLSDLCP